MFYQSIKHRKSVFYCFLPPAFLLPTFLLEMAENILFEDTNDGVLCKAAESFEDESDFSNKQEESKLSRIKLRQFVDLCALLFQLAACKIYIIKQIKKPKPCIRLWLKHSGYLRTLEKCRKHLPAARVFYISLVFSNIRRVLSQYSTIQYNIIHGLCFFIC